MKLSSLIIAIASIPAIALAEPAPDPTFHLTSPDGSATLRVGGYMQYDGRFFLDDTSNTLADQFAFRSVRPELLGTVFDHYDFRLLPDFAGGKIVLQEAYVEIRYSNAAKLRLGKFKVAFSLERLQLEVATMFVERGLAANNLSPNRDLGVQLGGELVSGVLAYQLGVFDGVADGGSGDGDTSDNKDVVARVVVSPLTGTSRDLGIGGAASYGFQHGTPAQTDLGVWKTQGQTTIFQYATGTTLMDTAVADGRHWRASAQADYFEGPVGVMAEYDHSQQHVSLADTSGLVETDAWQVAGQWVVVGGRSTLKGVLPTDSFDPARGTLGAIVAAMRVSQIRTNDTAFTSGLVDPTKSVRHATALDAGLDWLPNRSIRFALDLDRTSFHGGTKTGDRPAETSIVGRVQTVF